MAWSRKIGDFVEANRPQPVKLISVVVTTTERKKEKTLIGFKIRVVEKVVKLDSLRVEWEESSFFSPQGEVVYRPRIRGEGKDLLSEAQEKGVLLPHREVRVPLPEPILCIPIPSWVTPATWDSYLDTVQVFRSEVEETVAPFIKELQALIG